MQHYEVRNPANAIGCYKAYGPLFGRNHNLSVHYEPFNVGGCYSRPECPDYYTPLDGSNSVITLKKEGFAIDELEVYLVKFEGASQ